MHYRLVMMRFTLGFVRRNRSIASRYRYPTGTYPTPTHHQHKQALSLLQLASAAAAVGCRVRMYQSINFAAKSSSSSSKVLQAWCSVLGHIIYGVYTATACLARLLEAQTQINTMEAKLLAGSRLSCCKINLKQALPQRDTTRHSSYERESATARARSESPHTLNQNGISS